MIVTGIIREVQVTPVGGVIIKSSYLGSEVISDKNGRYNIQTVENDVLTISGNGFITTHIKVNSRKQIDIRVMYQHDKPEE